MPLDIRRCLLTGASGGIGAALAQVLAEQGITLVLQGRDEARLEALQQRLPGKHELLVADLVALMESSDLPPWRREWTGQQG